MNHGITLWLFAIFLATTTLKTGATEVTFYVKFRYPESTPEDVRSQIEVMDGKTKNSLGNSNEIQRNRQVVCHIAPSASTTSFLLKFKTTKPSEWVIDYSEPMQWADPGGNVGEKIVVNRMDECVKALYEIEKRNLSTVEAMTLLERAKRFLPDSSVEVGEQYYSAAHLYYARAEQKVLKLQDVPAVDRYNAFAAAISPVQIEDLGPAVSRSLIAERYNLLTSAVVDKPEQAGDQEKLAEGLNREDLYIGEAKKRPNEEWRDVLRLAVDNVERTAAKTGKDTDHAVGKAGKDVRQEAARADKKVLAPAAGKATKWMRSIRF